MLVLQAATNWWHMFQQIIFHSVILVHVVAMKSEAMLWTCLKAKTNLMWPLRKLNFKTCCDFMCRYNQIKTQIAEDKQTFKVSF